MASERQAHAYVVRAAELHEQHRMATIRANIRRLGQRMLEFEHRKTFRRQHSFKGRDRGRLLPTADEQELFEETLEVGAQSPTKGDVPRAKSPTGVFKKFRKGKLRPLLHEHWIVHDPGFKKRDLDDLASHGTHMPTPKDTEDFMSDGLVGGGTTPGGSPLGKRSKQSRIDESKM